MKNILFVDDDKDVLEGLERSLHLMKTKWNLFFAQKATLAFEILENESIDLLIADIAMAEMNGIDMLRKIRENNKYESLDIMILTGMHEKALGNLVSKYNVLEFLTKPVPTEVLISTIEEFI